MKERGNYGTMGKAVHLYIKEICGGRGDHDDQNLIIMITLITSILVGSSRPKVLLMGGGAG
jgi:hypothetical protein